MHRTLRRAALVTGATVTTFALTAGSAMAHECYIADQSAKGAQAAGTHSQVWFHIDVVSEFLGDDPDPELETCFREGLEEAGVPASLAIMGKTPPPHEGVLGSKNPHAETKAGDGQGIDHVFSSGQFDTIVGVLIGCGGEPPEME